MSSLRIAHLYPGEMNIYGDTGNVIALARRIDWRGMHAEIERVGVGDPYDFTAADLVVAGGGEDRSQLQVAADLQDRAGAIHEAVEAGTVFLTICGTYQLFGHRFVTHDGEEIPGIGVFDLETLGGSKRMIGNVVLDTPWGGLVGFENHSGRTFLAAGQQSLGSVRKGYGNNEKTSDEGAVTRNAFGSYLHGSLLPKNPGFADELILRALRRRYGPSAVLEALDDDLERQAAQAAIRRA
ncbi:MAG: glutamine amidotransferase [Acidimicrobiia bacterium]|nr:glutamine amidotransferase [Acidimicrobiia bacterium]